MQAEDLWIDLDKDQITKLCLYFSHCLYVLKQLAVSFHLETNDLLYILLIHQKWTQVFPFWSKTSSNFSCKSDIGMKRY